MNAKKQTRLIAITHSTGSHLRGWRHPDTPARPATDVKAFIKVAQELERGLFDALFLSETTGIMPGPDAAYQHESMVNDSLDPTLLLAAVAAATKHIGLITTASTSLTQPYTHARLLASLDQLSAGRAGWNVVTSRLETEARNFGLDPRLLRSPTRYDVATEFVDVVKGLWFGNRKDGTVFQYNGKHFWASGSLGLVDPPQGYPIIVQAGASAEGREFIGREADIALAPGGPWHAKEARDDIRRRAAANGRDPDSVIVLAVLPYVLVAGTRAEADARLREFTALLDPMERQRPGILAGTADDIADLMEDWLDSGATDGFAVGFPYLQGQVAAFTRHVIPELQRRGRFRTAYPGATLRENLGLAGPHTGNPPPA